MVISKKIEQVLKKIPIGTTFTYQDLSIEAEQFNAAAKTMERLVKKGVVKRISTGVFYKPKITVFGELKPGENELLNAILFDKGKRIAYVTGTSLYNRLGLTTQVPKVIKVASRDKRILTTIGNLKAKPVKSYLDVSEKNYYLLGILDAIKDFKQIPDLDKISALNVLGEKLRNLTSTEIGNLTKYALKYPPRTRALLGAILEANNLFEALSELKKKLNPLSQYNYNIKAEELPTVKNWNII